MAVVAYDQPIREIDLPEPEVPPGFALLEVLTCGVCFSDVKTARGAMPFSDELSLPHVPGHEIFGRVERSNPPGLLQEGLQGTVYQYWPCGSCERCQRGDEPLCERLEAWIGFTHDGGFRERLAIRADRLIRIPDGIDPVLAAPMSCALGTAYRSVVVRGGVRAGSRVVVLGLGGVGIHAAQVARAAGAVVIGFDLHQPTLDAAGELGLDARRADEPEAEADLFAGGRGADVVIESVGHDDSLAKAVRVVRPGGRIVAVGYSASSTYRLPSPRVVLDEIQVVGSRYAHRDDLEHAIAMVDEGAVRPIVGMVRPLERVNEVFDALVAGEVVGRAVLDVAGVMDGGAP